MERILSFMLTLMLTLTLIACSRGQQIPPERTIAEYYEIAYRHLERRNFRMASEEFLNIERNHPASPWAADALIMAAYSSFRARDFAGTITITDRFMRFHPGHADVPYVLYLRGMSFYRQVSDVRREQGMSFMALQTFQQLTTRFPDTEFAENAQNKIIILKNYIAGKTLHTARRDMQRQNWPAAINNLQSIVTQMQETQMTEEALFRLTESFRAIGLESHAAGYAEMLRLNFPYGDWTRRL